MQNTTQNENSQDENSSEILGICFLFIIDQTCGVLPLYFGNKDP